MDNYKYAAQNRLRFPSNKGELMVEQLFDLPLKAPSNYDLDTVAQTIHLELKSMGETSFVNTASNNPKKKRLEVALEIVVDVIKTKQDEIKEKEDRKNKAALITTLEDAIAQKKREKISETPVEQLEAQLASLRG
jgi:hypothetical protein